jgi:hypothetical protein
LQDWGRRKGCSYEKLTPTANIINYTGARLTLNKNILTLQGLFLTQHISPGVPLVNKICRLGFLQPSILQKIALFVVHSLFTHHKSFAN